MRSPYRLKEIAAACLLSCFIAGAGVAMTTPGAADSATGVSVARDNKADRLPPAPVAQQSQSDPASTKIEAPRKGTPLGCDPAFSPVADPARGHIFKRCMA